MLVDTTTAVLFSVDDSDLCAVVVVGRVGLGNVVAFDNMAPSRNQFETGSAAMA